jgi:hypothetical protein
LGFIRLGADVNVDLRARVRNIPLVVDVIGFGILFLLLNELLRVTIRKSVENVDYVTLAE